MNINELFAGAGLVIDDQIFNENKIDKIHKIVADIEGKGIPLVKYDSIPDLHVAQYKNFSFILLDWELLHLEDQYGMPIAIDAKVKSELQSQLLSLLHDVADTSFLPIFIFSNSSEREIERVFEDNQLWMKGYKAPIFIQNKSSLITEEGSMVWSIIESWVKQYPSIYVCKILQNSIKEAEIAMLKDFSNTHSWPSIMWQTFINDSVNPNHEFMELLWQNTHVRLKDLEFDTDIIEHVEGDPSKEELQSVLRAQRYTSIVDPTSSLTGDFYKIKSGKYGLNIRPACDCVNREGGDGKIYLIYGSELKGDALYARFDEKFGNFNEHVNDAIVGPMDKNKYILFKFNKIEIVTGSDYKAKKIGRVLPPFITHITEKYGLYIQRQGLPRLPMQAVFTTEQMAEHNDETGVCGKTYNKKNALPS